MEPRITKLRKLLVEQKLDAILISSVSNLYYLTGYYGFLPEERDAYLLITKKGGVLITSALYITAVKKQVKHLKVDERSPENPTISILSAIINKYSLKTCGFEANNLTVAEFNNFSTLPVKFVPANIDSLRMIKDKKEINTIKKACRIGDAVFSSICEQIKYGITEKQLGNLLELMIKKYNADISFRPIVAFGSNASVPHHLSGTKKLRKNCFVLLDFGV